MDALDLIKQDHKRLRKLLEETLGAEGSEREQRMDFLRTELVAHERMEEEVLYPRLREENKARETVLEGYEEHHDPLVFKKLIYEMRFDEASAKFAEFGPFYTGLQFAPGQLATYLEGEVPAL